MDLGLQQLLDGARRILTATRLSPRTRDAYLGWIRRYVSWAHRAGHDPADGGTPRRFIEFLAAQRHVAPSTQNQAESALAFLFREVLNHPRVLDLPRAKGRWRLPTVLSPDEVGRVLGAMKGPHRLIGALLYGSGLRLSEGISLRVKDVSFDPPLLTVRHGKGGSDRTTVLPRYTLKALRSQAQRVATLHQADRERGGGWAALPRAVHRNAPHDGYELAWQFLFPGQDWTRDPATGRHGRYHVHASAVQRAFKTAVRTSGIAKRATCHTLRHSFATHALRMGYDIHILKEILGHQDVKTTMVYVHAADRPGLGIRSPLDRLMDS